MIPGLIALIGMILGGGSTEYFYIAEFDKGINKYVDEKERKKELHSLKLEMFLTYFDFINELSEITSDKEWEAIMKDLNKAIKKIKEQ